MPPPAVWALLVLAALGCAGGHAANENEPCSPGCFAPAVVPQDGDLKLEQDCTVLMQSSFGLHSWPLDVDALAVDLHHSVAGTSGERWQTQTMLTCLGAVAGNNSARDLEGLAFIHIPRTGGSTIEDCTAEEPFTFRWGARNEHLHGRKDERSGCYLQHVPPAMLSDIYAGQETFCVVRDPYERAISQLGFQAGFFPESHECSPAGLNAYLRHTLPQVQTSPYSEDCHLLPQTAFVRGWDHQKLAVNKGGQSCNNVLRFETLTEDFNRFMASKGLTYRLSNATVNGVTRSGSACQDLSTEDLAEDTLKLLEETYQVDFELLGYSKLPRKG
mmetsp:Transcript_74102/g.239611  ORF Transcript_74102/g.239611 Transcript_74102/m.239611 type:complete len:330 (-) Transcript_74102:47-1036(-)